MNKHNKILYTIVLSSFALLLTSCVINEEPIFNDVELENKLNSLKKIEEIHQSLDNINGNYFYYNKDLDSYTLINDDGTYSYLGYFNEHTFKFSELEYQSSYTFDLVNTFDEDATSFLDINKVIVNYTGVDLITYSEITFNTEKEIYEISSINNSLNYNDKYLFHPSIDGFTYSLDLKINLYNLISDEELKNNFLNSFYNINSSKDVLEIYHNINVPSTFNNIDVTEISNISNTLKQYVSEDEKSIITISCCIRSLPVLPISAMSLKISSSPVWMALLSTMTNCRCHRWKSFPSTIFRLLSLATAQRDQMYVQYMSISAKRYMS